MSEKNSCVHTDQGIVRFVWEGKHEAFDTLCMDGRYSVPCALHIGEDRFDKTFVQLKSANLYSWMAAGYHSAMRSVATYLRVKELDYSEELALRLKYCMLTYDEYSSCPTLRGTYKTCAPPPLKGSGLFSRVGQVVIAAKSEYKADDGLVYEIDESEAAYRMMTSISIAPYSGRGEKYEEPDEVDDDCFVTEKHMERREGDIIIPPECETTRLPPSAMFIGDKIDNPAYLTVPPGVWFFRDSEFFMVNSSVSFQTLRPEGEGKTYVEGYQRKGADNEEVWKYTCTAFVPFQGGLKLTVENSYIGGEEDEEEVREIMYQAECDTLSTFTSSLSHRFIPLTMFKRSLHSDSIRNYVWEVLGDRMVKEPYPTYERDDVEEGDIHQISISCPRSYNNEKHYMIVPAGYPCVHNRGKYSVVSYPVAPGLPYSLGPLGYGPVNKSVGFRIVDKNKDAMVIALLVFFLSYGEGAVPVLWELQCDTPVVVGWMENTRGPVFPHKDIALVFYSHAVHVRNYIRVREDKYSLMPYIRVCQSNQISDIVIPIYDGYYADSNTRKFCEFSELGIPGTFAMHASHLTDSTEMVMDGIPLPKWDEVAWCEYGKVVNIYEAFAMFVRMSGLTTANYLVARNEPSMFPHYWTQYPHLIMYTSPVVYYDVPKRIWEKWMIGRTGISTSIGVLDIMRREVGRKRSFNMIK